MQSLPFLTLLFLCAKAGAMSAQPTIGVMGGGRATAAAEADAYQLGRLIARQGWTLLNGGRRAGIMDASAKGAYDEGGLTVGILPDDHPGHVSPYIRVPVLTGMGNARNCINVLSSRVVVACPGGAGTLSEIALALKTERPVILFKFDIGPAFASYRRRGLLFEAHSPEAVIELIKTLI
jgi:uncharacterized protein (TIGR00725 family)